MPRRQNNSLIQSGTNQTSVESGRIINVYPDKWLVDVRGAHSGRLFLEIEVLSPYFHFYAGEGIYPAPEVGANVKVCTPGDSPPFVLGFVGAFEREDDDATFRGGRPKNAKSGDLIMKGRDGNQVWLHRGGVLELGCATLPRSFYIPLENLIRHMTLNYELHAGGGLVKWDVENLDQADDDHPASVLTLLANNKADDEAGSVRFKVGHLSDEGRVELLVAANALGVDGDAEDGAAFKFTIAEDGDVVVETAGDFSLSIEGDAVFDVSGGLDATIDESVSVEVGSSLTLDVTSNYDVQAVRVTEDISASKVVDCPNISMGGSSGVKPLVMGSANMLAWFFHTHPVTGSTTGPPTPPIVPAQVLTQRLRGK